MLFIDDTRISQKPYWFARANFVYGKKCQIKFIARCKDTFHASTWHADKQLIELFPNEYCTPFDGNPRNFLSHDWILRTCNIKFIKWWMFIAENGILLNLFVHIFRYTEKVQRIWRKWSGLTILCSFVFVRRLISKLW